MDKPKAVQVMSEVWAAIEVIAQRHNLILERAGHSKYDDTSLRSRIELREKDPAGNDAAAKQAWDRYAPLLGLDPALFGRDIRMGGTAYKVVGVAERASKRPVILKRLSDGRTFRGSIDGVKFAGEVAR